MGAPARAAPHAPRKPARKPARAQVADKVDDLLRLLGSCPDEATKTLTCLTLATRMVSQCDSQVRGRRAARGGGGRSRRGGGRGAPWAGPREAAREATTAAPPRARSPQVANCASFAFPLALVCVRVGGQAPLVIDLIIAKLHQARA